MHALLLLAAVQTAQPVDPARIVSAARSQVGVTLTYDSRYRSLAYPMGDVPLRTGICCDVVVRALRNQGIDLQKLVHEDMKRSFSSYPNNWGLRKPDPNIDHRRVPNLMTFFKRKVFALSPSGDADDYRAGDIVAWDLGRGLKHIGIVSDRRARGTPLIIHNIGSGAKEEDILFAYTIIGHYRVR